MKLFSPDNLAAATIWAEAEGEPFEGKCAVGEVIRNRMKFKFLSDGTVGGTVALRYQFSALNDDAVDNHRLLAALALDDSDPVVRECQQAWIQSEGTNLTHGAVSYYNPHTVVAPAWASQDKLLAEIGNHRFFAR